ncbi:MAG: hypothetical protein SFZ23_05730 [Planctomycetota bacterium]|nr:hypothetical protein [Planctomycetota bacterium]
MRKKTSTTTRSHQNRTPGPTELHADASRVLFTLRESVRRVLDSLPFPAERGRDLEHNLKLHKTLAWRLARLAYDPDPLARIGQLPGAEGFELFLNSAARAGAAQGALRGVRTSLADLEQFARTHAGDRDSLEVLLRGLSSAEETSTDLRASRRAAFRCAAYSWGVQTGTRILGCVIRPAPGGRADVATIRGHVRVRRVRSEGMLRLSRTVEHDTDQPDGRRARVAPIEPESSVAGVPVLPQFSSVPLPALQAVPLPGNNIEYCFADQKLGEKAAITIVTGEVRREIRGIRWKNPANSTNVLMITVRDPAEEAVIDLWAPPEFGIEHRALVVSAAGADPVAQAPECWLELPVPIQVQRLGRGMLGARLPSAVMWVDAVRSCMDRLNWNPADFELHRVRLEYPIVGTAIVLQTTLPDRPASGE